MTSAGFAQPAGTTPPPAAAPTSAPAPFLITTGDKTPLRCGAGNTWYVVAELPMGTVLRLDGESDGFFRVEYPQGLPAVVKVIEGELKQDRGVVVLTRRSPLMAFNTIEPFMENCYKRVFAERQLEPGTELKYLGPVEDRKGELAGYKVVVPSGAKGFVLPTSVRTMTPEEIAAHTGTPAKSPETATETASTTPSTGTGEAPVGQTNAMPEAQAPAVGPTADTAAPVTPPVVAKPVPTNPNDALIDKLNTLEASYQRVMRSTIEDAEFAELISAYNQIAENATIDETGEKVRAYADAKIALLNIKAELQKARLEYQAVQQGSVAAEADLAKLAQLAAEARGYAVVGRLLTSAIYDGTNLPRMFRVQSLERGTSRTIAYILPNEGLALDSLTGKIVGVRGDATAEATPRIPVVRASAVDVLTLEPAQEATVPATSDQPQ